MAATIGAVADGSGVKANLWLTVPVVAIVVLAIGSQLGGPATVLRIAVASAALTVIVAAAVAFEDVKLGVTIASTVAVSAAALVVLSLPSVTNHLRSPHGHNDGAAKPAAAASRSTSPAAKASASASGIARLDGSRPSLVGAQLPGADLRRLDLAGSNMTGAFLPGADLEEMTLNGTDLTNADLSGACLRGADLQHATLNGAVLAGADVTGAVLPLELDTKAAGVRAAGLPRAPSCR